MKRSSLVTLLAPIVCAGSLNAASDYLLEIDGIKGESTERAEAIEIQSFSWSVSNTPSAGQGGGGAGKVIMNDVHFTATVSKATPQLLLACASGAHIPKAVITCRKSGGDPRGYYTITLEDVRLSSLKQTGQAFASTAAADSLPAEEVAFYYTKVTLAHTADDGTVTTGTAIQSPVE